MVRRRVRPQFERLAGRSSAGPNFPSFARIVARSFRASGNCGSAATALRNKASSSGMDFPSLWAAPLLPYHSSADGDWCPGAATSRVRLQLVSRQGWAGFAPPSCHARHTNHPPLPPNPWRRCRSQHSAPSPLQPILSLAPVSPPNDPPRFDEFADPSRLLLADRVAPLELHLRVSAGRTKHPERFDLRKLFAKQMRNGIAPIIRIRITRLTFEIHDCHRQARQRGADLGCGTAWPIVTIRPTTQRSCRTVATRLSSCSDVLRLLASCR